MKLSTGKVAFPIEFDNGDKAVIYFNPNDPNLPVRMKEFQDVVSERIKGLGDIALNSNGKPSLTESLDAIDKFNSMQKIICEELDKAFNGEISAIVFKHCSPFAIVDGDYFIIQFIEAIAPEIEKRIKAANGEVADKMKKHIAKYNL